MYITQFLPPIPSINLHTCTCMIEFSIVCAHGRLTTAYVMPYQIISSISPFKPCTYIPLSLNHCFNLYTSVFAIALYLIPAFCPQVYSVCLTALVPHCLSVNISENCLMMVLIFRKYGQQDFFVTDMLLCKVL